ncbi:DUF4304 domain-containing protein [Salinispora tropica]|uniref:DUF4304 domain-containing protein n=1 Tax=Salinispora tropica TaxID=168695 RepID=UPI00036A28C2|nr:DUF4304 domain-containing protein [Salinispora tropica]
MVGAVGTVAVVGAIGVSWPPQELAGSPWCWCHRRYLGSIGMSRSVAAYINIGLVLAPEWEWDRQRTGWSVEELPRHYDGGWRRRLRFSGLSGNDQWRIADEDSAAQVSARVRQQLDDLMPQLLSLLDRDVVLNRTPDILGPGAWLTRAWILAGEGRTDELEHLLFVERPARTHNSVPVRTVWNYATGRAPDTGQR